SQHASSAAGSAGQVLAVASGLARCRSRRWADMPHAYSDAARRNLLATSADEPYLTLLEIRHPDLAEPVRLVNDVENITINDPDLGSLVYIACPFRLVKPDDVDQQLPRATLEVDNIGRELTQWLEASNGGKGARCRLM